jgi:hypothetical protein
MPIFPVVYWGKSHITLCVPVVSDPRFKLKFIDFVFSKVYPLTGKETIDKVEKIVCGLFSAYTHQQPHLQHLHNKYPMYIQSIMTHGWNGTKNSMMIFELKEVQSLIDIWMKTQFEMKSLTNKLVDE